MVIAAFEASLFFKLGIVIVNDPSELFVIILSLSAGMHPMLPPTYSTLALHAFHPEFA
jgi:hypothetical protein